MFEALRVVAAETRSLKRVTEGGESCRSVEHSMGNLPIEV